MFVKGDTLHSSRDMLYTRIELSLNVCCFFLISFSLKYPTSVPLKVVVTEQVRSIINWD